MKLASLDDGSRDGQLVVVSRDLRHAVHVQGFTRLQQVLDDWAYAAAQLQDLSDALNAGRAAHAFGFDPAQCLAPLPRACQWADASAYLKHVERVRRARGAELPPGFEREPLMYQGGGDAQLGAQAPIAAASEDWGIDFEAEIAVVTDDVPAGCTADAALGHVRLLMLVNDISLRELIPGELAKGFGFVQSKPARGFSPVAVTPDELGAAWRGGRLHLEMQVHWNGRRFGKVDAGAEMHFHFGQLIAHLARTRALGAGCIVGSGTVAASDAGAGCCCIVERRALEQVETGAPVTGYLRFGDSVRIEMLDARGASVFGAIEQAVVRG
jgi:fumarylacetoacetate (FAA) hydrolase